MILLIVDDQITVTTSLKEMLLGRVDGIEEILTANSAAEARLVMATFPVNILLTDIEMPGEDGFALFQWTMQKYPEMVGVFLTSHAEFAYAKEAIRLGGFDYVLQPARMEEICETIGRAVQEVFRRQKVMSLERSNVHIQDQREVALELLLVKAREENRNECDRLYNKLQTLFTAEFPHCVFWTARIRIVRFEKKNNSWDTDLMKMVFVNILNELLEEQKVSAIAVREDLMLYDVVVAAEENLLEESSWKKALETFTSFINTHMDFQVAVYPDRTVSRVYDAKSRKRSMGSIPGIYWEDEERSEEETAEDDIAVRIRKAQAYIRENISRSISRSEVAQYLHINEDYFSRSFKKYTGQTFKDYDILVRMETAKTLLEQTKLPVSMIAGKVGFDNFSHFSQAFRKYSGKTPSEYR